MSVSRISVVWCQQRSLRQTDHSCKTVVGSVAFPSLSRSLDNEETLTHLGLLRHGAGGESYYLLHITSFIYVYCLLCDYEVAIEVFTIIIIAKRNATFSDSE
jgi:hypothetical protein